MEDEQLIHRVLDGNREAFLLLIERHKRLVMHMVSRVVEDQRDVEEVCQDVFVKIYETLSSFGGRSKLSSWIATVSYRMAINFTKKKGYKQETADLDECAFRVGMEDESFETQDFTGFVHRLLVQMPQPYRSILTMFHLDGFSYPEIVEITGMPEGTVKNYLFRARKKLQQLSEPYLETELDKYNGGKTGS